MNTRAMLTLWVLLGTLSTAAQESQPANVPAPPLTAAQAATPETVIFALMRDIKLAPADKAASLREDIQRWRGFAHDRLRKAGSSWVKPADFAHRREVFGRYVSEAQDELKNATTDAEKRTAAAKANVKLLQAAQSWQDPLMQSYLLALVNLRSGKPERALPQAAECAKEAPFVPAFRQLHGMTLLAGKRPLEAVEALTSAVQIRADNRDAVALLKQALADVPGTQINDPVYKRGQETLQQAEVSGSSSGGRGLTDMSRIIPPLPGKTSSGRGSSGLLPTPAFDRLLFRQATAIAVAKNTLLVDSAIVEGASDLYLRLDSNTYVLAKVKRGSGSSRQKAPPLTMVTVDGYEFTPLVADNDTKFEDGERVSGSAVGVLLEMGVASRGLRGRLAVAKDGSVTFSGELQPGESATAVVAQDRLAGVLLGRTDIAQEDGGPSQFVPLKDLLPLLEQARKSTSSRPAKTTPKTVSGSSFVIIAVVPETFQK